MSDQMQAAFATKVIGPSLSQAKTMGQNMIQRNFGDKERM